MIVDVWIKNIDGQYLISKRASLKNPDPNTCGCAIVGDDSLSAALREVKEELGITLDAKNGKCVKRFLLSNYSSIIDVWLFLQDIDISSISLQLEEIDDAMWINKENILQMIQDGVFLGTKRIPYVEEIL